MGNLIRGSGSGSSEESSEFASLEYNYPPKNGHNYFSNTFIMGSDRFSRETSALESYLFGENLDLNFLAKPTAFPYLPPQPHEPTRTLRSLINIRRESLRFVKCKEQNGDEPPPAAAKGDAGGDEIKREPVKEPKNKTAPGQPKYDPAVQPQPAKGQWPSIVSSSSNYNPNTNYNVEFVFDTDVKCAISIHCFCYEEVQPNSLSYISKNLYISSPTYFYEPGANQLFSQPNYIINPSLYNESELVFKPLDEEGNFIVNNSFPFVIQCVSLEGEDPKQSHSLIATIERNHDGKGYALKPFKQKIFEKGVCYLQQELFGIERKSPHQNHSNFYSGPLASGPPLDDDLEDSIQSECVVCLSEQRDTLILPCRHLCLCNLCADSLRFQASSCPICRSPFMALLHIRAVRRRTGDESALNLLAANSHSPVPMMQVVVSHNPQAPNGEQPPPAVTTEEIPAGFEAISLIDALNSVGEDAEPKFASQKLPVQLETANSCGSLYESTNEEEEEDSIGGAENIELASGAQLNLSKSSSITTGHQETTKLLFKEQPDCPDSIRNSQ